MIAITIFPLLCFNSLGSVFNWWFWFERNSLDLKNAFSALRWDLSGTVRLFHIEIYYNTLENETNVMDSVFKRCFLNKMLITMCILIILHLVLHSKLILTLMNSILDTVIIGFWRSKLSVQKPQSKL